MKKIQLNKGFCAIVDDEDFERLSKHKWFAQLNGSGILYAKRRVLVSEDILGSQIAMHRLILGAKAGMMVDHISGDTLDNRKCNLRFCTSSQNNMNRRLRSDNVSGYKGVFYDKKMKMWVAQIKSKNKSRRISHSHDAKEAARAYDKVAKEMFGEFARLNFPNY